MQKLSWIIPIKKKGDTKTWVSLSRNYNLNIGNKNEVKLQHFKLIIRQKVDKGSHRFPDFWPY